MRDILRKNQNIKTEVLAGCTTFLASVYIILTNALILSDAGMNPEDIDYINTHGTSTPVGDVAEILALQSTFGDALYGINIGSTKSMTGHLLGATGAIEALAGIMAITKGIVPPTINLQNRDEKIDPKLNLTENVAQRRDVRAVMSNTFGFGGHNSTVIFRKL